MDEPLQPRFGSDSNPPTRSITADELLIHPRYGELLIVFAFSLTLLLLGLFHPPQKIFDEFYYTHGAELWRGAQDSNPEHPPLAKMLIGAGIIFCGDNPLGWRIASALFGSLLMSIVYAWLLRYSRSAARLGCLLLATNGFWFVLSRLAMLSIFEITLAVLGLLLLEQRRFWLCGLALGLSTACRWNGAFLLALALVYVGFAPKRPRLTGVWTALKILPASLIAYCITWLPVTGLHPLVFLRAQLFILHYHTHFHGGPRTLYDPWYHWLIRAYPENSAAHLLANPVSIVAGLASVFVLVRRGNLPAVAFFASWLIWPLTPRSVTYYYYFLEPLTFLSLVAALAVDQREVKIFGYRLRLATPLAALSVAWFVVHYPSFLNLEAPYDTLFQL